MELKSKDLATVANKLGLKVNSGGNHMKARATFSSYLITTAWTHGKTIPVGTAKRIIKHQLKINDMNLFVGLVNCPKNLVDYLAHLKANGHIQDA